MAGVVATRREGAPVDAPARSRRLLRSSILMIAVAIVASVGAVALPASAQALSAVPAAVAPAEPGNYMHDADAAWIRPVPGRVTSVYGPRPVICNPAGCSNTFHDGTDFGSPCGTPIKAISPGRVTFAAAAGGFGQRVLIDHGAGVVSVYGHIQTGSFKVSVGQQVSAGTVIASVGATGVATGCHLDLKIRIGGVFTNPAAFMALRGIRF